MKYLIYSVLIFLVLFGGSRFLDLLPYLSPKSMEWVSIIDLKKYNNKFVAQGMAQAYNKFLLHSVHEQDEKSYILVFDINNNYTLKSKWIMPPEATHASDLEFHNNMLYAVDYKSNTIYIFDFKKSLVEDKLILSKKIQTLIKGSGSASIARINNKYYYILSSFLYNDQLYFIELDRLLSNTNGKLMDNDISFSLDAEYFIQGLYTISNKLFMTVNKLGKDLIYEIRLDDYVSSGSLEDSIIAVYNAPTEMVEDVIIYKNIIITSGEDTNKIYKAKIHTQRE